MGVGLKFTPLEFETFDHISIIASSIELKFTPLEFETSSSIWTTQTVMVKIYSVGVWNLFSKELALVENQLKFTPLEFETF